MPASDASGGGGGSGPDAASDESRSFSAVLADSGRLAAIPGRRGKPVGRGRDLAEDVQRALARAAGYGVDARAPRRLEAEHAAAAAPSPPPPASSTAPFHATSTPPSRSSGAAYSHSTGSAASARARHDVAARRSRRPLLRARVDHLHVRRGPPAARRARGSGIAARALDQGDRRSGSAAASASPGQPAPAPRSAIRRAVRTLGSSSADQRVGDVAVDAPRRSRTAVGAVGSAASSSSSAPSAVDGCRRQPYRRRARRARGRDGCFGTHGEQSRFT